MKILMTGASGKLGTELQQYFHEHQLDTDRHDFTQSLVHGEHDLILHIGAYTDVKKAETDWATCFQVNAFGTFNLVQTYKDTPFIYISTEYAKHPLGIYALTKYLGEEVVASHPNHLIVRTLFKPTPWPFEYAYEDQYTQGDYVDVIAKELAHIILAWDRQTSDMLYCGTGRKTMFELAKKTRPDVKPNTVRDYVQQTGVPIPYDYE